MRSKYFEIFFFLSSSLKSGLKILSKPIINRCAAIHLWSYLQSTGSIDVAQLLRVLEFLEWQMSFGFNLKSPTALTPDKKDSLFFDALKPGIDFSFLAMKVLGGIYFQ